MFYLSLIVAAVLFMLAVFFPELVESAGWTRPEALILAVYSQLTGVLSWIVGQRQKGGE